MTEQKAAPQNELDAFAARYGFAPSGGHFATNPPMAAGWICARDDLLRMMRDVAADAVSAERERCALLCEDMVLYTGFDCAAAIRQAPAE